MMSIHMDMMVKLMVETTDLDIKLFMVETVDFYQRH